MAAKMAERPEAQQNVRYRKVPISDSFIYTDKIKIKRLNIQTNDCNAEEWYGGKDGSKTETR